MLFCHRGSECSATVTEDQNAVPLTVTGEQDVTLYAHVTLQVQWHPEVDERRGLGL